MTRILCSWSATARLGVASCAIASVLGMRSNPLEAQEPCAIVAQAAEGWSAYQAGDMERARAAFSAVQAECPELSDVRVGLGYVELRAGELMAARGHFEAALERAPDHVDAVKGLARVEARQGRVSASESRWRSVIALYPNDPEALVGLGQTSRWQGRLTEAASWLDRAEQTDPGSADLMEERQWLNALIGPSVSTRLVVERDSDGNRMVTSLGNARWSPWANVELRWDGYVRSTTLRGERTRRALGHQLSTRTLLASGWSLRGGLGGSETSVLGAGVAPNGFLAVSSPSGGRWEAAVEVRSAAFDITTPTIERSVAQRGLTLDLTTRSSSQWTGSLSASAGAYEGTESNAFWRSTVEVASHRSETFRIASRLRGFGFANDARDGYFDPSWFVAADLPFRWQQEPAPWAIEFEVAPGLQRSARAVSIELSLASSLVARYRVRPGQELWISAGWAHSGAERFTPGSASYRYSSIAAGAAWAF